MVYVRSGSQLSAKGVYVFILYFIFISSFTKYFLNNYEMPGTALGLVYNCYLGLAFFRCLFMIYALSHLILTITLFSSPTYR